METEDFSVGHFGRMWSVPKDAVRDTHKIQRVCPNDKFERGKGFNWQEDSIFRGICQIGSNQLIACYGNMSNWDYSPNDFAIMCKNCPHAYAIKDGYDPYRRSMFDAFYLSDALEKYIAQEPETAKAYAYFISDGEYVKIGKAKDPNSRLKELQTASPRQLKILYLIPAKSERSAYEIESRLHCLYSSYNTFGEWYDVLDKLDKYSFKIFDPKYFEEEQSC